MKAIVQTKNGKTFIDQEDENGNITQLPVNPPEPADGTLSDPVVCWNGLIIYPMQYSRIEHDWVPTGQVCPPEPADGELADPYNCWDDSIIFLKRYDRATHSYVPTGATCPPIPPNPLVWDLKVADKTVVRPDGSTAYTGGSYTSALTYALHQASKVIYVPTGSYAVTSTISVSTGISLVGDGPDKTIFNFTNEASAKMGVNATNVNNIAFKGFKIVGHGNLQVVAQNGVTYKNFSFKDIDITSSIKSPFSFGTWTSAKGVIDGLTYENCRAINCCHNGFILNGDKANRPEDIYPVDNCRKAGGWIKNVSYKNCLAQNSGVPNYYGDGFATGFDLAEGTNVQNVTIESCVAEGNRASGFHLESWPYTFNVNFFNCRSDNNGLPAGSAGYGYLCRNVAGWHETKLTNCTAKGNKSGPCTCQAL